MPVASDVVGIAAIAVSMFNAGFQFARLGRGLPVSLVVSAPRGALVRVALLTAVAGVTLLTGSWAGVGVMAAIITWELTVQATALASRRARRSAGG